MQYPHLQSSHSVFGQLDSSDKQARLAEDLELIRSTDLSKFRKKKVAGSAAKPTTANKGRVLLNHHRKHSSKVGIRTKLVNHGSQSMSLASFPMKPTQKVNVDVNE